MQIVESFSSSTPPPGGRASEIARQLSRQQARYQRTFLMRSVGFWWYRILLIVLSGLVAGWLGQFALSAPVQICGVVIGLVILFNAARYVEFGLLLAVIVTTALFPKLFSIKALDFYPVVPVLLLLLIVLLAQVIFHVRQTVLPSFWTIWPQLGLIVMAIISTMMVQAFWTHGVPHKINGNPILYSEVYGVMLFFFPPITLAVTTMILAKRERLIIYIQYADLILALIVALAIFYDFRRIGADIYTFRFSEPRVLWMSLRAMAQLLALGAIIGYARFLFATRWRVRLLYGVVTAVCLVAVYLSLENSWWLEVAVALMFMTIIYSRRLFLAFGLAALPLIPIVKAELAKLQAVKADDYTRFLIWNDMLRVWSKQPVLGVGPGDVWEYDQVFTNLSRNLRDFNITGLGVAHNGYLQILAEMGPIGLFLQLAMITVLALAAVRLYRRSPVIMRRTLNIFGELARGIGLDLVAESQKRDDRILGMICIGLILGSAVADFVSGSFFLPARQVNSLAALPEPMTTWFIVGCVLYKDHVWRMTRRRSQTKGCGPEMTINKEGMANE